MVPIGSPRVLVTPWQSRGGQVTIESIRLAHPVAGLRGHRAISSSACGSGFATQSILAYCPGLAAPHGARLSPTSTTTVMIATLADQPVKIDAPDVLVTYRVGLRTRTVALGLHLCLSSPARPRLLVGLTGSDRGSHMATLDRVARMAAELPEVTEGDRHGHRTWFVAGQAFAWERPFSKADIKRFGRPPHRKDRSWRCASTTSTRRRWCWPRTSRASSPSPTSTDTRPSSSS